MHHTMTLPIQIDTSTHMIVKVDIKQQITMFTQSIYLDSANCPESRSIVELVGDKCDLAADSI